MPSGTTAKPQDASWLLERNPSREPGAGISAQESAVSSSRAATRSGVENPSVNVS
jgi:hypothetical protein